MSPELFEELLGRRCRFTLTSSGTPSATTIFIYRVVAIWVQGNRLQCALLSDIGQPNQGEFLELTFEPSPP